MSEDSQENMTMEILDKFDYLKRNSGIIIAASFSIIIFLLSLIEVRTLFLDLGILCLLISTVSLFELLRYLTGFIKRFPTVITNREKVKTDKFVNFMNDLAIFAFFIGLLLFFYHFELILIVYLLNFYLIYRGARFIEWRYTFYKWEKENISEKEINKFSKILNILYLIFSIITLLITVIIFFFTLLTDLGIFY